MLRTTCVALAIVFCSVGVARVLARGGGHGGGHHGGHEHHEGNHGEHHHDHHHIAHHHHHHDHEHRAFSHDWYAHHGGGWGWGYGDAWTAATALGVSSWLGWENLPAVASTGSPVVINDSNNTTTAGPAANQLGGVSQVGGQQWLSLGVYAVTPEGSAQDSHLLHLAVDKQGQIRGNYFDVLSDQEQPVLGAIDKATQKVTGKIGNRRGARFETNLKDLTSGSGPITITFDDGRTDELQIVRLDSTPEKDEEAADATQG